MATYPIAGSSNKMAIAKGEAAKAILSKVRDIRNKNGLKQRELLDFSVKTDQPEFYAEFETTLKSKAYLSSFTVVTTDVPNAVSFLVGQDTFFVGIGDRIDLGEEKERLEKELLYNKGFQAKTLKKLSNERFVGNAPAAVIDRERQKLADAEAKIKSLEESLAKLN